MNIILESGFALERAPASVRDGDASTRNALLFGSCRKVSFWHKTDIEGAASECPLSGAKQTFRTELADVRF